MRFSYSPEVDILMVCLSEKPYDYGEDNEEVIIHHDRKGNPLSLEVLDGKLFVMFASDSVATGQETANPDAAGVPYAKERHASVRSIPRGDADLRFRYHPDSDALTVKFRDGTGEIGRRNQEIAVDYDRNEMPVGYNHRIHRIQGAI